MVEILSIEDRVRAAKDIACCTRLQYWAWRLLDAVCRLEAERAARSAPYPERQLKPPLRC